jgi:hypothetical protein
LWKKQAKSGGTSAVADNETARKQKIGWTVIAKWMIFLRAVWTGRKWIWVDRKVNSRPTVVSGSVILERHKILVSALDGLQTAGGVNKRNSFLRIAPEELTSREGLRETGPLRGGPGWNTSSQALSLGID